VYEPTTVEVDRVCGEGKYRSYTIYFVGRLIEIVETGHTTMRPHSGGGTPRKGYTAEEVSRAYPEFAARRFLGPTWNSRQRGRDHTRTRYRH
jgi:hypothetical protein